MVIDNGQSGCSALTFHPRRAGLSWSLNSRRPYEVGEGDVVQRFVRFGSVLVAVMSLLWAATPALAADVNGSASAWGTNASGQLGDGTTTSHLTAAAIGSLSQVDEVAGGRDFAFALSGGTVSSWGAN